MNTKLNKDRIKLMKSRISIERSEVRKLDEALIFLLSNHLLLAGKDHPEIENQPYFEYFKEFKILIHEWSWK